ncbi:ubiquitin-conjugating enzyme/RWD-like protein [Vararia minispora EC-137]|uniref:Ubiquitin-conjugating enzyme/RWD-like protein n=1 Tax=Vararia minispora EC-137 TaxID=1314806 RepID=A0ACB8QJI4_9AGAM|nr:ubiquitin-conjugating enzyme/RWD-like protein [Vararia minispora EC-137]
MSVTPTVMRRLMRELNELRTNPPEGIRVTTDENNMLDVTGIIQGPEGTPYAGGYFRVKFKFTDEFPAAPPKCWFATKIFHPNVSGSGEICVNTLKKDWSPSYGISHILVTVKCLLIYPNPDSALDEEAGKLLQENYDSYCARARLITSVHATPKVPPPEFSDAASSSSSSPPTPAAPALPVVPLPDARVPASTPKGSSPPLASHPLQQSASNKFPTVSPLGDLTPEKPVPLGPADANVAAVLPTPAAVKAVKRGAAGAGGAPGAEKRKKALKRL